MKEYRKKILEFIRCNSAFVRTIDSKLLDDDEFLFEVIRASGLVLRHMGYEVRNDLLVFGDILKRCLIF